MDNDSNRNIADAALRLPLSRRRLLAVSAGALVLAACGDDDDGGNGGSGGSSPTATSAPSQASGFPVSVTHKYGTTQVPSAPQRVLSLGYNEQDALLALGIKPIAARYWFGDESTVIFPWAKDEAGGANPEVINMPFGQLDFEKIAALRPDFISAVYSGITADEYQTLTRIAPTLAQSPDAIDFGMPWQDATVSVGKALGLEAKAKELVQALDTRFAAARTAHSNWNGMSVAVVAPRSDGQIGVFASGDLRSRMFSDLGFKVPASFDQAAGQAFFANLSKERINEIDQDLVIIHQLSYLEGGIATLEADPLWTGLNAYREGRIIYLDFELDSAYSFNSVLSMDYFLSAIVPRIEAAVDGDPNTKAN